MRLVPATVILLLTACQLPPSGPQLLSVEPTQFDSELGAVVAMRGAQLVPAIRYDFDAPQQSTVLDAGVSAWLSNADGGRVDLVEVTWVDATQLSGRIEGPVTPGLWNLHVIEPRGAELSLTDALLSLECTDGECVYADGGLVDAGTPCEQNNYRDRDGDGFGAGDAVQRCGGGYVSRSGDCNDRDNLTYPGARDVCNGLDDDCDGTPDPGCGDAGWTNDVSLRDAGNDFIAAASFERGALWVASSTHLFLRAGDAGFVDRSDNCPTDLTAMWAMGTGELELWGARTGGGVLARSLPSGTGCRERRDVGGPLVAIVGFPGVGTNDYVGVRENGDVWRWRPGEPPLISPTNLSDDVSFRALHGQSRTQLIAVGSLDVNGSPRARAWLLGADGGWQEERPLGSSNSSWARVALTSVWSLSATQAVAVGENGTVLVRGSGGWRGVWSETFEDLTAVRAFSTTRYYVTSSDGRVRQRSGWNWETVFRASPTVPLRALTGTAEDDLWAVGDDGTIGRGPH